jgi:hypothetical protein
MVSYSHLHIRSGIFTGSSHGYAIPSLNLTEAGRHLLLAQRYGFKPLELQLQ